MSFSRSLRAAVVALAALLLGLSAAAEAGVVVVLNSGDATSLCWTSPAAVSCAVLK